MLLLTCKPGKRIVIGDCITVMVTKIKGNQVHLGIEAPRDVGIDREHIRRQKLNLQPDEEAPWDKKKP